jgi:glycosyltransferase involved in cell wall biosynthesis
VAVVALSATGREVTGLESPASVDDGGETVRVSVDVTAVPASPVGAGRYTIDLVGALAARRDVALALWCRRGDASRWQSVVIPNAPPGTPPGSGPVTPPDVRAVAPRPRPVRLAWEQVRLPGLLRSASVVVHHGPHYTMPRRSEVPCVVTIHDLTFFDHPEWHERSKVWVFRRAIREAARRADALVCVSAQTASRLQERLSPRSRVFVVPHGVDHRRFRPDDDAGADEKIRHGLGVRPPYVVFLGTIEPRKAAGVLLRAFDLVAPARPDLSLVLVGRSGWGAGDVDRALADMHSGARVRRLGYVPDEALPALLRGAAAAAYPALDEGFGLPALEALACGAPLVTTLGTPMAELARDCATLVAPGAVDELAEALRMVIDRGSAIEVLRRRGLAVAATYTWEASAAGHMAAYRAAASGGAPAWQRRRRR